MARRTHAFAQDIGARIESARAAAGLTVRQLADLAMVHRNTVLSLSRGKQRNPGVATIADLARALGVSPEWLAFGVGSPPG